MTAPGPSARATGASTRQAAPTLASRLAAAAPTLGPAEQQVARVLSTRAGELPELSTAQVADLSGTSRASVVRTCQRLGYTGFQQLRVLAVRDAAPAPREAHAAPDTVIGAARALAEQTVQATDMLEEEPLRSTVADLAAARRVLVVAGGLSALRRRRPQRAPAAHGPHGDRPRGPSGRGDRRGGPRQRGPLRGDLGLWGQRPDPALRAGGGGRWGGHHRAHRVPGHAARAGRRPHPHHASAAPPLPGTSSTVPRAWPSMRS
jgi:hypothetical protein